MSELQVVDPTNTYYLLEPALQKSYLGKEFFVGKKDHRKSRHLDTKTSSPFDLLRQRFPQLMSKWKNMKQDGSTIK